MGKRQAASGKRPLAAGHVPLRRVRREGARVKLDTRPSGGNGSNDSPPVDIYSGWGWVAPSGRCGTELHRHHEMTSCNNQ